MKIVISSLHFSPAFIGHMKAWYKLCQGCGYTVLLYFSEEYEKFFDSEEYLYTTCQEKVEDFAPEYAVVQNIGLENLKFFTWCKNNHCFLIYILHEPYMGFSEIIKEGNMAPKQLIASLLNSWLCRKADKVIVCSEYARYNCHKYMKSIDKKMEMMPLLFLDDFDDSDNTERQYVSMIGIYAFSHGSDVFLQYIKKAYMRGTKLKFQIATRSDLKEQLSEPIYHQMEKDGILLIQQGRPLTEKEMCAAYRRSLVVWNGYRRSTQSGVLPNSYMQGTPVIATHLPSFDEYVIPGVTGVFMESMQFEDIDKAIAETLKYEEKLNIECRKYFLNHFYYDNNLEAFRQIIDSAKAREMHKSGERRLS